MPVKNMPSAMSTAFGKRTIPIKYPSNGMKMNWHPTQIAGPIGLIIIALTASKFKAAPKLMYNADIKMIILPVKA